MHRRFKSLDKSFQKDCTALGTVLDIEDNSNKKNPNAFFETKSVSKPKEVKTTEVGEKGPELALRFFCWFCIQHSKFFLKGYSTLVLNVYETEVPTKWGLVPKSSDKQNRLDLGLL